MKLKTRLHAKVWRHMLMLLVCLMTTTTTWAAFNIYVNTNGGSGYCIHTWGGTITLKNGTQVPSSTWRGTELNNNNFNTAVVGNKTYFVVPVTSNSINYILNSSNDKKTSDLSANSDTYVSYSGGTSVSYIGINDTYYVKGNHTGFFPSLWDNSDAQKMTTTDGINYTWTSGEVVLTANQSIEYKVHDSTKDTWYPSGNNPTVTASQAGTYTLTITYTAGDDAPTATLNRVITDDTYYVKGNHTGFFPSSWDNSDAQKMATTNNVNYTWTSGVVALSANQSIEYKVHNSTNNTWYPSSGNNPTVTASQAGTYTLTITYTVGDAAPIATLNRVITHFYLMDDHDGWNISSGRAFTLNGGSATLSGVELNYNNYFFFSTELASGENGWTSIQPYRLGPSSGTTTAMSGTSYTAATGNGNSYQPEKSGVWSFNYNLGTNEWTGTLTAVNSAAKWYLVSSYGDGGFNWSQPIEMTRNGNTFTCTKTMNEGDFFIFAQQVGSDWGTSTRYTCNGNNDEIIANGTTYTASRHGNKAYKIPSNGVWTFTYNYLTDQWSASVEAINTNTGDMYVIGEANGNPWQANMGLKMTANADKTEFTLKNVQIISNAEFAFATQLGANEGDWSALNLYRYTSQADDNTAWLVTNDMTQASDPQVLNLQVRNGSDRNFKMEHTGRYNITVNWSTPSSPTVTIVRVGEVYPSLYMLGGPKEWAGDDGTEFFTTDGMTYTANMTMTTETDTYFQFATQLGTNHNTYPDDQYRFGALTANYLIDVDSLNKPLPIASRNNNDRSFKMGVDGIFKVTVTAERNGDQLIPKTVTLQKIASVGNITVVHLEKNGQVTNPVLHAYNKERYNETHGGNSVHVDRPTKEDLINTREVLRYEVNDETTTADGRKWWTWTIENAIADFYFTRDESETDSRIMWRRAGEVYFTWPNEGSILEDYTRDYYAAAAQEIADCATMLEGHYYVYFTNTPGWKHVLCHAWYNDNGTNVDMLTPPHKPDIVESDGPMYPGALCTMVGYDKDGYEVWRYDFGLLSEMEHLPTGIIFNNGVQTVRIKDEQNNEVKVPYDYMTGELTTDGKYQTGDFVAKNGGNYDYCGMISLGRSLGNIIRNGIIDGPPYTIEEDLLAVWLDRTAVTEVEGGHVYGALYCKDLNQFVSTNYVEKSLQQEGEVDYVIGTTDLMGNKTRYDQSNWVKLTLSQVNPEFAAMTPQEQVDFLATLEGKLLKSETVTGQLVNNKNPEMRITEKPTTMESSAYDPNVYVTPNFLGSQQDGLTKHFFFVTPKPQEYATITWAMYGGNDMFYIPTRHTVGYREDGSFFWMNEGDLDGYFKVKWDLMSRPSFIDEHIDASNHMGQAYRFHAIIRLANDEDMSATAAHAPRRAPANGWPEDQPYKYFENPTNFTYIVSPIDITDDTDHIVTAVNDMHAVKTVKGVRYYNVAGMVSDRPFDGVNIVVTEYSDGTTATDKQIR